MSKQVRSSLGVWLVLLSLALLGASSASAHGGEGGMADNGMFFVDHRNLNGGADGNALVDLDPDSDTFGQILQNVEIGEGILPHHLYYNRDETRLYNTTLGGEYLYEVLFERDADGVPVITDVVPIDVGENIVGEDIYFAEDGSKFWVTFIGGTGGLLDGTIGLFDAQTNELIETITGPVPEDRTNGEPYVLWPHGISANEELGFLAVTSTNHPDFMSGFGNTVTFLDIETNEPVQTSLVAESWEDLSLPVEILLLRDEFDPYALVTTVTGGDPDSHDDKWLYVSFSVPGAVQVFSLDNLPDLELVKTLPADAGAHHMGFFTTQGGREVMVIQNNLLNFSEPVRQNAGTLMIVDIHSGEVVGTVNMAEDYGLMPESIEAATGNAHFVHH